MDKQRGENKVKMKRSPHWMISSPWAIFWLLLTPLISMIDFYPNQGQIYKED